MLPFISSTNSISILYFTTNQPLTSRTLTIKFTFRFLFSVGKSGLQLRAAWRRQDGAVPSCLQEQEGWLWKGTGRCRDRVRCAGVAWAPQFFTLSPWDRREHQTLLLRVN